MDETNAARPTLRHVAKRAGISVATASTALTHPAKVKPGTLQAILEAVAQLGYVRNGAARTLVSNKTHSIGIVVPTIDNPLFSRLVAATQQVLSSRGYVVLIGSYEYVFENHYKVVLSMIERGVDGIVLVGAETEARTFDLLRRHRLPYVLSLSIDESGHHHSIGISNTEAMVEVVRAVVGQGHATVAVCGGFHDHNERARQREEGALAVLRASGIEVPPHWRLHRPITLDGGRDAFRTLCSGRSRPTALVCGTDFHALGALDEAVRQGVAVPGELSITGFDDIEATALASISLTTVRPPVEAIGTRSAMHLLELIEGGQPPVTGKYPVKLMLRQSLARPRRVQRTKRST